MTHRERWVRARKFQDVDHVPDEEFGYWNDTFGVWHEQGMSPTVTDNDVADAYFGFAPRSSVPVRLNLIPPFEEKVIEETESYRIERDGLGVLRQVHKSGRDSIPHYLDYPLKGRREWEELFRPKLQLDTPERYPENDPNWERMKAQFNDPAWDRPVGIFFGSLFGEIRNWMGFERITTMMYDDPELMHEIIQHVATLGTEVIARAVREIRIDYAAGWEDMAFRQGPMISPAMFREFLVPRYKMITESLHANGVDLIFTDCDGRVNDVVDAWLEGGLTGIFPCEVGVERDQTDPVAVREKYGDRVFILGGVNKHALIAGRQGIRDEIARIRPYVEEGGWIPHMDHRCPPSVAFEDYLYYLDVKRDTFGIPRPEEFERRPEIRAIKSQPGYAHG